jgi:NaMN:DMB phosphoribosyltransferase
VAEQRFVQQLAAPPLRNWEHERVADGGLANLVGPIGRRDAAGTSRAAPGSTGRLGELAGWLATAQGRETPRPLERIRVLRAGDRSAGDRLSGLCQLVGAELMAEELPGGSPADLVQVGAALADAEADAGTDLLVATMPYEAPGVTTSALIGLLATKDASLVTDTGLDDASWMVACAQVRDEIRRNRPVLADQLALLDAVGSPETGYLTGLLLGAAARRTPVLLAGVGVTAAALVAHRASFRAADWWLAGDVSTHPAHAPALQRLSLSPLTELAAPPADIGVGLLAVPLLRAAAAS